jgi:trk system potassium uptake protein TrkA
VVLPERHRWAGRTVRQLKAPKHSVIVTVLRDGSVCVPTGDLRIQAGDHLVMFALPDKVEQVQALFK